MVDVELAERVADVLAVDHEEFHRRVEEERDLITEELRRGSFNNPQAIVGLEYEFYGTVAPERDAENADRLVRVPRSLLRTIGFEKELGLHNAEMSTSPQPLNRHGLAAQREEVIARLSAALRCTRTEGIELASDGLWTLPPTGERANEYLTASVEDDGVIIAPNMSAAVRYHTMANTDTVDMGKRLDAPHVTLEADTVMPESLISSVQPHYQVPKAVDLPERFRYALRIAGPLLALGVNSPFFPADLYDDDATVEEVLARGHHEHRIGVFETVMNPVDSPRSGKVRFPRDLTTVEEAVDRIASDEVAVPMPIDAKGRFDDEFAHFRLKHGTYWRWVRPVFDGPSRAAANARVEFRPIPAQPTVRDSIAFQAAFAGLMEALPRVEHPVASLDWDVARENFYAAAREGLSADLVWIANDGTETTVIGELYGDLLAHAEQGLLDCGFTEHDAERYLRPLRERIRRGVTPASWKRARLRSAAEAGADLGEAIAKTQRAYLGRQRETLLSGSFVEWLG